MFDFETLKATMKSGRGAEVCKQVESLLAEGAPAKDILEQGLLASMGEIGQKFKLNQVFVPEVLIAARAMKAGMTVLKPHLIEAGVQAVATAVMGTVKGDLHDIGKNLVIMMLEGAGFAVVDAGVDVTPKIRGAGQRTQRTDCRTFRAADDHHAQHEKCGRGHPHRRSFRQSDDRRRTGNASVL